MITRFRAWLRSLHLDDPLEHRQGPLLQIMLLALIGENILTIPVSFFSPTTTQTARIMGFIVQFLGVFISCLSLYVLRRKQFIRSVNILTFGTILTVSLLLIPVGMSSSWIIFFLYVYPITFAGLIGTRRLLWGAIFSIIAILIMITILENIAPSIVGFDNPKHINHIDALIAFVVSTSILGIIFDSFGPILRESLKTTQQRESELEVVRVNQQSIIDEKTNDLNNAIIELKKRESYLNQTLADLQENRAMVRELSSPIIPVLQGVLVVPLVGSLDSDRTNELTSSVLQMAEHTHARSVIFDITGVPVVDTHVAQVLIITANAIRLLGAQVLLVGMRPEVAQTMVALHINLGTITSFATLREAVEALLHETGWYRGLSTAIAG